MGELARHFHQGDRYRADIDYLVIGQVAIFVFKDMM
jgi:hypothetical protein